MVRAFLLDIADRGNSNEKTSKALLMPLPVGRAQKEPGERLLFSDSTTLTGLGDTTRKVVRVLVAQRSLKPLEDPVYTGGFDSHAFRFCSLGQNYRKRQ